MDAYPGEVARKIDRLVVAGHEATPPLEAFERLGAHPGLFSTMAVVLLARPIAHDDVVRTMPYLPPPVLDALLANNAEAGVLDGLSLTDTGREVAAAVVAEQEGAIAAMWAGAPQAVASVESITLPLVAEASTADAPTTPSAFALFAAVVERPTVEARVLRAITAMRYWRADAHRAALSAAGLDHAEAHALNRVWDAHRGVERVGQGRVEPGRRGLAAIEAHGLAADGVITAGGIELREAIEADTDTRTAPLYSALSAAERDDLLSALTALPD